jgi:hypothetical protein
LVANPLGAASLAITLPALCELNVRATWDQGSCAPEPGLYDQPI